MAETRDTGLGIRSVLDQYVPLGQDNIGRVNKIDPRSL